MTHFLVTYRFFRPPFFSQLTFRNRKHPTTTSCAHGTRSPPHDVYCHHSHIQPLRSHDVPSTKREAYLGITQMLFFHKLQECKDTKVMNSGLLESVGQLLPFSSLSQEAELRCQGDSLPSVPRWACHLVPRLILNSKITLDWETVRRLCGSGFNTDEERGSKNVRKGP